MLYYPVYLNNARKIFSTFVDVLEYLRVLVGLQMRCNLICLKKDGVVREFTNYKVKAYNDRNTSSK